jgi:hypothetical protein
MTMEEADAVGFEQLVDWLDGRLPAHEAAAVAAKIETADETTRADLAWLQTVLGRRLLLATPPPALRQRLASQYSDYRHTPTPLFPRLLAHLTFDSDSQRASLGLRGAAYGAERQVVYSSDTADIALNISARLPEEKVDLAGQLFPLTGDDEEPYSVQLLQDAVERGLTLTDELGEFSFKSLPPGRYDIIFTGSHAELLLTAVDLHTWSQM